MPQQLIDVDYDSPQPPYPDFVGPATPGDATQRQRPTARAKAALARAAVAGRRERTVLVMGHGASHVAWRCTGRSSFVPLTQEESLNGNHVNYASLPF